MLEISIAAEKIGSFGGFPVTNSLLATWIVMALLVLLAFFSTRKMTLVPNNLQSIMELLIGGLYDFYGQVAGKHIKHFFPLLCSFFLFIITANWFGLLPGVGTIGFNEHIAKETSEEHVSTGVVTQTAEELTEATDHDSTQPVEDTVVPLDTPDSHEETVKTDPAPHETAVETKFVPLLRASTADINMTLALAIIAVVAIQFYGFKLAGYHYAKRFVDVSNPINFFIGALEIVSETSKIISFAFRLFGNIFAGEVLLAVMAFLMPFIAPLPFLTLELFVGFIQALVFSMLTSVFLSVGVSHGEHIAHQYEQKKGLAHST